MKKTFIISFLISLILVISSQIVYSQTKNNLPQYQTFEEWCINRENLAPETRHTVEVLLEFAQTKECNTAQSILDQEIELGLVDRQITDVSPLASLMHLESLVLYNNQITDISPLANLMNLEELYLSRNQIKDVSPIANLINLAYLEINDNPVRNVSSLANLINLTYLVLDNTQIRDVSPLANLIDLQWLFLNDNQIMDI